MIENECASDARSQGANSRLELRRLQEQTKLLDSILHPPGCWPLEIDVARGNRALFRYAGWSPHWAVSISGNPEIDANCFRGRHRIDD